MSASIPSLHAGRFKTARFFGWAVIIVTALSTAGCSFSDTATLDTVKSLLPLPHPKVAETARALPYASIDVSIGRRGGLLVLAQENAGLTFWMTRRREVIVLNHGYLQSTTGFPPRLTMSRRHAADGSPVQMAQLSNQAHYTVQRFWQDASGGRHAGRAEAQWHCDTHTVTLSLPLVTKPLHKCVETLAWAQHATTHSTFWRDDSGHVWKARVTAWPGAQTIGWQVARPWWPQQ